MSTPERSDDPGEHGYGGVAHDVPEQEAPDDSTEDNDRSETDDDRRRVGGGGRGEGDGSDYPGR